MHVMSQIEKDENDGMKRREIMFSAKDISRTLGQFFKRCEKCRLGKYLVIILGMSQAGKSTLINRLREMEVEEDKTGKIVVTNRIEEMAEMGNGTGPTTKTPRTYELTGELTLLDTRGIYEHEFEDEDEFVNILIMQHFLRHADKAMVLYLTQFENYCSLTHAYKDMDLPTIFVANKCNERTILSMKRDFNKDNTNDRKSDSEILTYEIQELLALRFNEMKNFTVESIKMKYLDVSDAKSLEQIIGILVRKAKWETRSERVEIEITLNQLQTLLIWEKALDEGRLLYYDPSLSFSVDRIKSIIGKMDNYGSTNYVEHVFCAPAYYQFIVSLSSVASKLYWIVLAMRGRKQIPNNLKEILSACDVQSISMNDPFSKMLKDGKDLEEIQRMILEFEESCKAKIDAEEDNIIRCEDEILNCKKMIHELDQADLVNYEIVEFCEYSNSTWNEVFIERPVNVPNTTFRFIPGNEYTFNDKEKQKLRIKDGSLRGAFKSSSPASAPPLIGLSLIQAAFLKAFPRAPLSQSSVCEGKIELLATEDSGI
eukprot:MONOS_15060.1-p1 / transcript=MONOS_15060.1 / gene=MONOS_15060 / organism=Monocercomonoides_exilis_PA203 / gene_product=unspecified product / transcript_product=unspecified product / location=Mono_scaffold01136:397-2326(-) / protein_length=540 / sequence_SO=supercontig / SO=protein_coding / is_pseudo=false